MSKRLKIAIIFLDEIHHVYHFLTVAIELAETHEVKILTYPSDHEFLRISLKRLKGDKVEVKELKTFAFRAFTDKLKKRSFPRKSFWMKKNRNYILKEFDAVIFTDFIHHTILKSRRGKFPSLIKFPHGVAGGAYSFKKDLLDFDLNIAFGDFFGWQMEKMGVKQGQIAIVGYPKLDAVVSGTKEYFKINKPVVVYNPHFSAPYSSWEKMGIKILDYFYSQKNFNLIFAPHLHLFQEGKGGQNPDSIPKKYFEAENIFIDLGSIESVNMTYIKMADLYLGDVSSQVYEYLLNPRPVIFINTENVEFKDDIYFRFWRCGEVMNSLENFDEILNKAFENFPQYEPAQKTVTEENFYLEEGSTASERAAAAITEFLQDKL